jgi:hypothetical protein
MRVLTYLLACLTFVLALAGRGAASECDSASLGDAWLTGLPRADAPLGAPLESLAPSRVATCFKQVACGPFPPVACAGGSCRAAQRNCAIGEPGSVTCAGVTTTCPPCSTTCPEGLRRYVATGNCCPGDLQEVHVEECYRGEFVYLETTCSNQSCSGSSEL